MLILHRNINWLLCSGCARAKLLRKSQLTPKLTPLALAPRRLRIVVQLNDWKGIHFPSLAGMAKLADAADLKV